MISQIKRIPVTLLTIFRLSDAHRATSSQCRTSDRTDRSGDDSTGRSTSGGTGRCIRTAGRDCQRQTTEQYGGKLLHLRLLLFQAASEIETLQFSYWFPGKFPNKLI